MPTSLATTVRHISDAVPNTVNSALISDFHAYMKGNDTSERHQNNNLKVMIAYSKYLGPNTTFYQIGTRELITKFLDTKIKSIQDDPEKRWITTRNH